MVILSVFPQLSLHGERWLPADGEERALLDKAWAAAEKARQSLPTVCAYPQPPETFGPLLAACGFREITLRFLVETDAPDSADTSPERRWPPLKKSGSPLCPPWKRRCGWLPRA